MSSKGKSGKGEERDKDKSKGGKDRDKDRDEDVDPTGASTLTEPPGLLSAVAVSTEKEIERLKAQVADMQAQLKDRQSHPKAADLASLAVKALGGDPLSEAEVKRKGAETKEKGKQKEKDGEGEADANSKASSKSGEARASDPGKAKRGRKAVGLQGLRHMLGVGDADGLAEQEQSDRDDDDGDRSGTEAESESEGDGDVDGLQTALYESLAHIAELVKEKKERERKAERKRTEKGKQEAKAKPKGKGSKDEATPKELADMVALSSPKALPQWFDSVRNVAPAAGEKQADQDIPARTWFARDLVIKARHKGSVLQWVKQQRFEKERNLYEAEQLAFAADCLLHDQTPLALEVLARRIEGLIDGDPGGDYGVAAALDLTGSGRSSITSGVLVKLRKLGSGGKTPKAKNKEKGAWKEKTKGSGSAAMPAVVEASARAAVQEEGAPDGQGKGFGASTRKKGGRAA